MTVPNADGRIITFYSYKGGTGRSMALANVAWILASNGMRVLAIDWDLEGPGLHRYFHPFLRDKELIKTEGLIDFVVDFEVAAKAPQHHVPAPQPERDWFLRYANLLRYAVSLDSDVFPEPGTLDFVPAGRQDAGYAIRVNNFSWRDFYEKLGGGILLEAVKKRLRQEYDYVLIDSRTGVSDTSGICTVQMPDDLVVCFTLNSQSIDGAASAAKSAFAQRLTGDLKSTLRIWPVPTRIEMAEREKLEAARDAARLRFDSFLHHLSPEEIEDYWGRVEVLYEPFYAYEEVLSVFRDRPSQIKSMLASMQAMAEYLTDGKVGQLRRIPEKKRAELLAGYLRQSRKLDAPRSATLVNLAETLRTQGDLVGARRALEEAIAALTEQLGSDHIETIAAQDKLASLLMAEQDYKAASGIYEKLLSVRRKILGPEHPETISCMNNLAMTLMVLGDLSRAQKLQEDAVKLYEKVLGSNHPGTAAAMSNLATSYMRQGKFGEAESLLTRVLGVQEKSFGPDHPEVASSLSNLAFLFEKSSRLEEAEKLHRRALAIREKTLEPDHPEVAHSLSGIARVQKGLGKDGIARKLHERALVIREKAFGPNHPTVALTLSSLAQIEENEGRYKEARQLHQRALDIRERVLGLNHPDVALSISSLANIEERLGNSKHAEELHARALETRLNAFGPNHPDVALSLSSLAKIRSSVGDAEEARRLHERALAIRKKAFGLDHPDVLRSRASLDRLEKGSRHRKTTKKKKTKK